MAEVVSIKLKEGVISGNVRGKELRFYKGNPHSTDYFLASLGGCVAFFIKTVAEKRGHPFDCDLKIKGTAGNNRFSSINVDLYIHGFEEDKKEIGTIVRLAERLCWVKNSIATPVNLKIHVGEKI
jgi:uncharacterized OsmC-like protein